MLRSRMPPSQRIDGRRQARGLHRRQPELRTGYRQPFADAAQARARRADDAGSAGMARRRNGDGSEERSRNSSDTTWASTSTWGRWSSRTPSRNPARRQASGRADLPRHGIPKACASPTSRRRARKMGDIDADFRGLAAQRRPSRRPIRARAIDPEFTKARRRQGSGDRPRGHLGLPKSASRRPQGAARRRPAAARWRFDFSNLSLSPFEADWKGPPIEAIPEAGSRRRRSLHHEPGHGGDGRPRVPLPWRGAHPRRARRSRPCARCVEPARAPSVPVLVQHLEVASTTPGRTMAKTNSGLLARTANAEPARSRVAGA